MTKKRIPRKVLHVDWSSKKTRKGNPEYYFYLLSCGHVLVRPYSVKVDMDAFTVLKAELYLEKNCEWCAENKPVKLEDVEHFFGSAGLKMMDIHNEKKKLKDYLPNEAHIQPEERLFKYLDQVVIREHGRPTYREQGIPLAKLYSRMPFPHKCMHFWWELENGYMVGFNEHPSRGWSFPVKKIPEDYVSVLK